MIEIYGIHMTQLPGRETMLSLLGQEFNTAWRERHRSARDDRVSRASLAGISLLRFAGMEGNVLYAETGRPYLEGEDVDFNITHTDQQVFCAIARSGGSDITPREETEKLPYPALCVSGARKVQLFAGEHRVGIDAENLSRIATVRVCPLADRWFSEREQDLFFSDPTDRTFLRIWTRKEALAKWLGTGLSGLREADTTVAESMYGIRFWEYSMDDTVLSLCTHAECDRISAVYMLSNDEVENFFHLK